MADGFEVAKAYVTIVPTMQGAQQEITKELTGVTETASKSAGESGGSNFGMNFASAIKGTAAVIAGALTAATAAAVGSAVAAGKAFINAAKDTAAYGDTVDKTSQRLGITAKAYQELDYVLNLAGTSMDSMSAGFRTLTNKIDDARNGSKEAQEMFKTLGISLNDLKTMSTEDIFKATITGFQDMGDTAQRAALAQDILGRSGQQLAPLFNMTSDATREAIKTANEYGMVLSDEGVAASAQFTDSMTTMEKTVDGLKNSMMSNFLPAMSVVMDGVSQIFAGDQNGSDLIKTGITELIKKVSTYTPMFLGLAQTILEALLDGFTPMLPSVASSLFGFLKTALIAVTNMLPTMTSVLKTGLSSIGDALLTCLPVLFDSLLDLTKDLVTWLASGNNVKTFVDGIMKLVSVLATNLADALPILLPAVITIVGEIAKSLTEPNNVQMVVEAALYVVGACAVALVKAFPQIIQLVKDLFKNIWNRMQTESGMIIAFIVTMLQNIISKVTSWFGNLITNIRTKLGDVWSGIKTWFSNLPVKIAEAFVATKNVITGWAKSAVQWGKDMITGFINGIKNSASKMASVIKNFAKDNISKFLHFSVPDAGPLADADKWMPDMVDLMVRGLENGAPQIRDAVQDFASGMSANINAYGPQGALLGDSTTYNGGAVTINVYGAEGQNVNDLAQSIAQKLEDMTRRKELAYA